jgi:hypothetical protein
MDGLVLPNSHAILDISCRPLAHRVHEVLGVPPRRLRASERMGCKPNVA